MNYRNHKKKILDLTPKHLAIHRMQGKNANFLVWQKTQNEWFPTDSVEKLNDIVELAHNNILVNQIGEAFRLSKGGTWIELDLNELK